MASKFYYMYHYYDDSDIRELEGVTSWDQVPNALARVREESYDYPVNHEDKIHSEVKEVYEVIESRSIDFTNEMKEFIKNRRLNNEKEAAEKKRLKEIAMLRDLKSKYPND